MLHRPLLTLAAAVLPLLSACAPAIPAATAAAPAPAPRSAPGANPAAEAEVRAVIDQWVSAFNRDDAAGVARVYAPNGVHIVGGRRYEGAAAIQERMTQAVPAGSDFVVSDRRFGVTGDHAFETGVAAQTITPASGQPYRSVADYVAIHARQPDGSWKIQTLIAANARRQP